MKKYFVLAAIAMIAFAGCKKEESGMVTLKVGVENADGMDKQTYNVQLNRIMFNGQDAMVINGGVYGVRPLNEDNDPYTTGLNSYRADLNIPGNVLYGQRFLAGYPALAFDGDYDAAADSWNLKYDEVEWSAGLWGESDMICDVNALDEQGNVAINPSFYRTWPMVAYDECGSCIAENGRFLLRNTVAVVSPSFIYGINWFSAMNDQFGMGYDMNNITNANQLPAIEVDQVVLRSSVEPLFGPAHVEGVSTDNPIVVMDASRGTNGMITLNNCGTYTSQNNPNFTNPCIIGQIPVAVFQNETGFQMDVFFTIGNYHFVYHSDVVTFNENTLVRSKRTVLQINMRDAVNMNRFQML